MRYLLKRVKEKIAENYVKGYQGLYRSGLPE